MMISDDQPPYFFIRSNKQYVRIPIADVLYISSAANHVKIVTSSRMHIAPFTLYQMEELLPADSFCRINKGTIIGLRHVSSFNRETVRLKNLEFSYSPHWHGRIEERVIIAGMTG